MSLNRKVAGLLRRRPWQIFDDHDRRPSASAPFLVICSLHGVDIFIHAEMPAPLEQGVPSHESGTPNIYASELSSAGPAPTPFSNTLILSGLRCIHPLPLVLVLLFTSSQPPPPPLPPALPPTASGPEQHIRQPSRPSSSSPPPSSSSRHPSRADPTTRG